MAEIQEILVDAARSGNVIALDGILKEYKDHIDINFLTDGGVTLLMHAISAAGQNPQYGQYLEVVQLLVQAGSNLGQADEQYGRTPVHWAIYYHKADILTELLIAGGDVLQPDYTGITPILLAVQENSVECLDKVVNYSSNELLNIPDHEGRPPLLYAIYGGNVGMCRHLVQLGANLAIPDQVTNRTPLHWAAFCGSKDVLEFFAHQKGADAYAADVDGRAPIHLAAARDTSDSLQVLSKVFGNEILDLPDVQGVTPMMIACGTSSEQNITFLIKKKVNMYAQDEDGKCCLHWAVETTSPEAVICIKLLCKRFPGLMKLTDQLGRTALLWSCAQGSAANLSTLLDNGDDLSVVDSQQHTAQHWSTVNGNPECLMLLLQKGASPSSFDNQGAQPLHYAAQNTRDNAGSRSYSDTLHAGVGEGLLECLQLLLKSGAEVDSRDDEGCTPLQWGLQVPDNFVALSHLIEAGADPNTQSGDGKTGLHFAARQGFKENLQFLVESVGNIEFLEDIEGQTALFSAVEGDHIECASYLLEIGATVNHVNRERRSCVHVASSTGSVECLKLLHSHGADLEGRTIHGAQPLHEAAAYGHNGCVEYLLYAGCSIRSKVSGGTALHYATSGGHYDTAKLLIDAGIEINALVGTDEFEYATALDYAEATGTADLVELLSSHGARNSDAVVQHATQVLKRFLKKGKLVKKVKAFQEPPEEEIKKDIDHLTTKEIKDSKGTPTNTEDWRQKTEQDRAATPITERPSSPKLNVSETPITPSKVRPPSRELPRDIFQTPEPRSRPPSSTDFRSPARPLVPDDYITSGKFPEAGPAPRTSTSGRPPSVLQKAFSIFRKQPEPPPVGSVVGLYGAMATMLIGSAVDTKLGEKAVEVGNKVVHDNIEELKKEIAESQGKELPELLWEEEVPKDPTPIPTPSPPPRTPTPPTPVVEEDPLEIRRKKAKSQLALDHSAAFNAVNEMLRAQATNTKLKREFDFDRLEKQLNNWRQDYQEKEAKASAVNEKLNALNRSRMERANTHSQVVDHVLNEVLSSAKQQNQQFSSTMAEMGFSRRPTVAQWLEQKNVQKKQKMQDEMLQWDSTRHKREMAVTLTQAVVTKRAYKHMAWSKKKELQAEIRKLKEEEELISTLQVVPPHSQFEKKLRTQVPRTKIQKEPPPFQKPPSHSNNQMIPSSVRPLTMGRFEKSQIGSQSPSEVRITTRGFVKIPSKKAATSKGRPLKSGDEKLWKYGERVAGGEAKPTLTDLHQIKQGYSRATGPKDTPRNRSLVFVPPDKYKPLPAKAKRQEGQNTVRSGESSESSIHVTSLEWTGMTSPIKSNSTVQYHDLAGSYQGTKASTKKSTKSSNKVYTMKVLELSTQKQTLVTN